MYTSKKIKIINKELIIETGKIAKNTLASIFAEQEGTSLIATIVQKENKDRDFFPLKVDYLERYYASGKIPGNYLKREGRPSEREILIGRLIDRSIRPLFPKDFLNEVHITVTVLSVNPEINPDILAIIATSAALSISGIPINDLMAATRITYKDNKFIVNPKTSDLLDNKLELIIVGTKDKILMIEAECNEIEENVFIEAINKCKNIISDITKQIDDFKKGIEIKKITYESYKNIENIISKDDIEKIRNLYSLSNESIIKDKIKEIENLIIEKYSDKDSCINKKNIFLYISDIEKEELRKKILNSKKRLDNRSYDEIRDISIEINFLRNTHGSILFTRGGTQAIITSTLGVQRDAQSVDCVFYDNKLFNFMLHYNFPSYAVNEIGGPSITKRREIGHGNLARKALECLISSKEDFPYVIRLVSEITESDGSSSMATVCGGSLALMASGVPIKQHIAGIAMGIIIEAENDIAILSDISAKEDHIGDMDFKLAGSKNGITALQMDLKIPGIKIEQISEIIKQAKKGLTKILDIMTAKIDTPISKLSDLVPKIKKIKINKEKIKNIIGKNGVVIKGLTEKYNCKIDIDEKGIITVSAKLEKNIDNVITEINNITKDIEIGVVFKGKVTKITQFGAFINIKNKTDGLLHITKINKYKSSNPEWKIYEGMILEVIVSKITDNGKISLKLL